MLVVGALVACDDLLTSAPDDGDVLDAPLEELTAVERAAFLRGDAEFGRSFMAADGLGPIFNDVSCAACHSGDGRGRPENALTRIGSPDDGMYASLGGPQIQDREIPGALAESAPPGVPISLRLPPPVFGVGLIEAIPESEILSRADPDDANGDGISGRPNWVTPPTWVPATEPGAVKTESGLIYFETKAGSGASPTATDTVKVHYTGTLIDGTEFDSSRSRGEPAEFPLGGVIKCWTEGLQKMKPGGRAKLVCPSEIAYGDRGRPKIPGGATLLFDVELLEVKPKPAPAATPAPTPKPEEKKE